MSDLACLDRLKLHFNAFLAISDILIAWSPILDETGEGDSETEALENLRVSVRLRLQDKIIRQTGKPPEEFANA